MAGQSPDSGSRDLAERIENASRLLKAAQREISRTFWGQDDVVRLTLACMAAGGNLLAEGPTSTGKTRFVSSIAGVMGLDFKRIQGAPDLMPGDIIGYERQNKETGALEFIEGPIFTELLLIDEINRAGPKTQSAFLEGMEEKKVTVLGQRKPLAETFFAMATQNPKTHLGTYPLPEAQRDRFMIGLDIKYPGKDVETRLMRETGTKEKIVLDQVMTRENLLEMKALVDIMPMGEDLIDAASNLVRMLRPDSEGAPEYVREYIDGDGPSPRASLAFARVARALALFDGLASPHMGHIKELAGPVLRHRIDMKYSQDERGDFYNLLKRAMPEAGIR